MKTIWKYELEPNNHLRIPEGAEPLAVHLPAGGGGGRGGPGR